MAKDTGIKNIFFFTLLVVFNLNCLAQNPRLSDDEGDARIASAFKQINVKAKGCFFEQDSFFQYRNRFAMGKIYGTRIHFPFQRYLFAKYRKESAELEIYDLAEREERNDGIISLVFYNGKLVIYYLDASSGVYKIICDICTLDLALLDSKKYFILHSKIDKDDNVIVEFLE